MSTSNAASRTAARPAAARRSWLRGRSTTSASATWLHVAARNLGVLMRTLFGVGTPRSLQGRLAALCALLVALTRHFRHLLTAYARPTRAR